MSCVQLNIFCGQLFFSFVLFCVILYINVKLLFDVWIRHSVANDSILNGHRRRRTRFSKGNKFWQKKYLTLLV